ncbi:MAG: LysR family transcriptional regulator [[Pasteurella] mairii]|nr:LysR family transcriptional regulator [[Pasteurella] mairii]
MDKLTVINVLLSVVTQTNSFTITAEQLNISKSMIMRQIELQQIMHYLSYQQG